MSLAAMFMICLRTNGHVYSRISYSYQA